MMYGKMNPVGFIREVLLHDVRLDSGSVHWGALETNLKYLLMLDVDDLVWSFRKTADLPTPGKPYGGWEGSSVELRSHFVGHYLSATAQMWASTHNDTLKEKMTAVVSALSACQKKIDTGYLSAFPSKLFDRFEAVKPVWAPYYTIHMILAGLLDQYTFANNAQALDMTTSMVRYFYNRVQNVIRKNTVERHWTSLNEETGGMNDVLYRLFTITGDLKHLLLAHLFDKPCFLGLLAVQLRNRRDISRRVLMDQRSGIRRLLRSALTNGVLGIQRGTEPGVMIYMVPQGRGVSKAVSYHKWGTPFDSFWCCYGTGIESFSKLGDSIYFKDDGSIPSLYIIQYISSTLDWKSGKIVINQKVGSVVSSDPYLHVTLTSSSKNGLGQSSTLNLRIPIWTLSKGAKASLNAQNLDLPVPGSFLQVKWSSGELGIN